MIRRRAIVSLLACCLVALVPFATAQDRPPVPEARDPEANPTTPGLLNRIRGLFDIDLPHLDPPGTFRVTFNPRLGDLLRRDYIRLPTGVRWAVNDRLGFNAEAEAYATHGLGGGTGNYGFGMIRLGGKYLLPRCPAEIYQTSIGLEAAIPVGSPPYDLTDGHNHFSPSVVVERHDPEFPRWTQFAGFSFDVVTPSGVNGDFGLNTPRDDSLSLTGGAIYNLGQVKWTVQGTYTTTALITDGSQHFLTIRPSMLWFVPRRFTFNSKTQWIIGVGVRSTWGPDGYEFSTGTRVRAEITFGQALEKIRGTFDRRK